MALAVPAAAGAKAPERAKTPDLNVMEVKFDPIGRDRNAARVKVRNTTPQAQTLAVHIFTKSPGYANMGWGQPRFQTLKGGETKWVRCPFKIQGPVADNTLIRLKFYNPDSPETYDPKAYFEQRRYTGSGLKRRRPAEFRPVSQEQATEVEKAFREIQDDLRKKKYEEAWGDFTEEYQKVEFYEFKRFTDSMKGTLPACMFGWDKDMFLKLQPRSVKRANGEFVLEATLRDETWSIYFVREGQGWKVSWVGGYTPRLILTKTWKQRLLPRMQKRTTLHFDIHYFKDSSAEGDIDRIAADRESGYRKICEFVGKKSGPRILLVFFEDKKSKRYETAHQGMGFADGATMVEVYGEEGRLDPYHETTHVIMGSVGNPPAMFNEGFAVYMSQHLGAPPLKNLGGGDASLYERVRELKRSGEWIALEELLTYTEIGSRKTRPPVSYAEAGAFVKFLIDAHGKEKFLKAYRALRNSGNTGVRAQNKRTLKKIFGRSFRELEGQWKKAFETEDNDGARPAGHRANYDERQRERFKERRLKGRADGARRGLAGGRSAR